MEAAVMRLKIRSAIRSVLGLLLVLAAFPARASGQQPTGAGTQTAPAQPAAQNPAAVPAAPQKTTLADFAWLAGRWEGAWGPRVARQMWTAPKAGVMLGTFQLAENDKTLVLELFTLVEEPKGIKFNLRHFTPELMAWEKPGPTVLNLASADAKIFVFENPVDGQPKREILTRVDPDTYVARSEIAPDKGDLQATEITYHRQMESAPPKHRSRKFWTRQ